MDLNQTSEDNTEKAFGRALSKRPGLRSFSEAKGQVSTEELKEGIDNAATYLLPFYDSGVNIVNVAQEYMKPEQERDYEYIKDQFREAGQSAAIEGGLLLMGGVAGKYGAKGIKALADKVKQYEINPTAMSAFGAGVISKKPFKKTRKAYKLFIQRDDKLYPLFVNAADEVPMGEFLEADFPKTAFKGKRTSNSEEMVYVPTKGAKRTKGEKAKGTGDLVIIPDKKTADKLREEGFTIVTPKDKKAAAAAPFGKVLAVKGRPGWHASQKPVATHLGPEDLIIDASEKKQLLDAGIPKEAFKEKTFNYLNGKLISADDVKKLSKKEKQKVKTVKKFYVKRRAEDQVFAEVDMADDVDYESMLKSEGKKDINDRVPKGGSYRYQDGQADSDFWIVGGDMKVNRILTREETKAAQKELGVKDLPYRDEVESILGRKFNKGGLAGDIMYTGDEDYKVTSSYGEDEMQMNKGGAVDGQMQMAFMNEGGIADDGMDVDPVSGNEVPPGSLAEEVRDDIPAQLSEGEYVVPADVVRYYGVKFFEDLRDQAKMGLAQMEADGRIGGEPVPDGGPVNDKELSEQEMAAIREVMGMAEGGEVQNPYLQQQQLYSQPRPAPIDEKRNTTITGINPVENQMPMQSMASGGQVQGYQEGGAEITTTPAPAINTFDPGQYGLGFSFMGNQPQQQPPVADTPATPETMTLYGPNGEIRTFNMPLSEADAAEVARLKELGYTTTKSATPIPTPTTTGGGGGSTTQVESDPNSWMEKFDYTDMSNLGSQTSEILNKSPKGSVIGAFMNGTNAAQAAANIIIMDANGASKEEVAKLKSQYQQFLKDSKLEYMPKGLINGDRLAKDIVENNIDVALFKDSTDPFGNRIFKEGTNDFEKFVQKVGPKGRGSKGIQDTIAATSAPPPRPAPTGTGVSITPPTDTKRKSLDVRKAEAQTRIDAKKRRDKRKKNIEKARSITKGKAKITGKGAKAVSATQKAGPFNKGGLMNKKGDK